jgi:serine/threonine protein kinase/WD40 repeat protein/predicted  nucleic acid-binding Zn-ribbon protein
MDSLIGTVIKGYEIREKVGVGGFGAVYRAFQSVIEREVAIKIILPEHANQPEFIRGFETEAQIVARLEHPYIIPLFDYWRDPEGAFLVMRYLRGGSLAKRLEKGKLSPEKTLLMVDQIANALAAAHRNNIVHRDLKPDNILLDDEENAFLTDFGIARLVSKETSEDNLSENISGSLRYIAPEQLRSQKTTIAVDVYSLGLMVFEMLTGVYPFGENTPSQLVFKHMEETIPDITEYLPEMPYALDAVLKKATAKDVNERYSDVREFATDLRNAIQRTQIQVNFDAIDYSQISNPYKGLRAFQEADSADFFGRDDLIQLLLDRMAEVHPASRFLSVIGASGSGKSSVVKAGVVPAIRRGALRDSEKWFVVEMVPGTEPVRQLEAALLSVALRPPVRLYELLKSNTDGLVWAIDRIMGNVEAELLLIIDQFEEVFTSVTDEAERVHFLSLIRNAVLAPDSRVRVLITLRADFTDRPLEYVEFGELMRQRTEFVLPLSAQEIERAIAGPAQRVGLVVETDLIAAIVADVQEEPGALPLLQYALTEVFERREENRLTLRAYKASGGVLGALARRAEEVYVQMNDAQKRITRQMFLRLVTLGEGTEDTRRRSRRSEIAEVVKDNQGLQEVLNQYGQYRLLTFDFEPGTREPTLEVAHEALIREWQTLRNWLDNSRADVRLQRVLAGEANEWENSRRDSSFLLSGGRLVTYEEWLQSTDLALTQREQAYIDASIEERGRKNVAEEERKQREQETANRADQFAKRATQLRRAATALGVVGVLALLAVFAAVAQVSNTQVQVAAGETQVAGVQPTLDAADAQIDSAQTQIAGVEPTLQDAQQQISGAQTQVAGVEPTLNAADAQIDSAQTQIAGVEPTLQAGETQIAGVQPTLVEANAQVAQAQVQATSAQLQINDAQTQIAGVQPTLAAGQTQVAGVEPTLQAANSRVDIAETQVAAVQPTVQAAQDQINAIIPTLQLAETRVAGVEPTLVQANVQVAEAQVQATNAQVQIDNAQTQIAGVQPTLEAGQTQVAGVEPTLVQANARVNSAETQVAGVQPTLEAANAQIAAIVPTLQNAETQVAGVEPTLNFAETRVAGVEPTLEQANAQVAEAQVQATNAQVQIDSAQTQIAGVQPTLESGQTQVAGVVPTLSFAETRVAGVDPTLDAANTQIAGVEPTLSSANTQIAGVQPTLEFVESQVESQRQIADALRLVRSAQQLLEADNPDLAIALVLEAYRLNPLLGETQRILNSAIPLTVRLNIEDAETDNYFGTDSRYVTLIEDLDAELTALDRFIAVDSNGFQMFSSDERFLAIAVGDSIEIWSPSTRTLLHELDAGDRISTMTFSPNSQRIVAGTRQGNLVVYDAGTGTLLFALRGHRGAVLSLVYSPVDDRMLSGGDDRTAILWDLSTGVELQRLEGHRAPVLRVTFNANATEGYSFALDSEAPQVGVFRQGVSPAFRNGTTVFRAISPDGEIGVTGGIRNQFISLYDADSGVEQRRFQRGDNSVDYVENMAFSNDNLSVLVHIESRDYQGDTFTVIGRRVEQWDIRSGELLGSFDFGQEDPNGWDVYSLTYNREDNRALVGIRISRTFIVTLWDLTTFANIRQFKGHQSEPIQVAFSANSTYAVSSSSDGNVRVWDIGDRELNIVSQLPVKGSSIIAFNFNPDESVAYVAYDQRNLTAYDTANGEELGDLRFNMGTIQQIDFNPTQPNMVAVTLDGMNLWDLTSGTFIYQFDIPPDLIGDVVYSPDGSRLYFLSNNRIYVFNLADLTTVQLLNKNVSYLAVHPNGEFIAGVTDDEIWVYDLVLNQEVHSMRYEGGPINSLAFSPDGGRLITAIGEPDNLAAVWDIASETQIYSLIGHRSDVTTAVFSPDGLQALTGSLDNTLILWDMSSGQPIRQYLGHTAPIVQIFFNPEGNIAYSISSNIDDGIIGWAVESARETVNWTYNNRYIQQINCSQRLQYGLQQQCENDTVPTPLPTPTSAATATPTATPTLRPTLTPSPTSIPLGLVQTTGGALARVRSGAGSGFALVTQVPSGTVVELLEIRADIGWAFVRLPDDTTGWMSLDFILR